MNINTIPLEARTLYVAEGGISLGGGTAITNRKLRLTTDDEGTIKTFEDGTASSHVGSSELWDILKITDTTTGATRDLRLHSAASSGSIELAKQAITEGADVHLRIKLGVLRECSGEF